MHTTLCGTDLMQHRARKWFTRMCERQYMHVQVVALASASNNTCKYEWQQKQRLMLEQATIFVLES